MPTSFTNMSDAVIAFAGQQGNYEFTSMVGAFIGLGESDVYRNLRHDRMVKSVVIGSGAGTNPYPLPDDFLEAVTVTHAGSPCTFKPPDVVLMAGTSDGPPTCWAILGGGFIFDGTPTNETVVVYFARLTALVEEQNVLVDLHPDLFLYAALAHAMIFLRDEQRQGIWEGLFQRKLQEIDSASWHARIPKQQTLTIRSL